MRGTPIPVRRHRTKRHLFKRWRMVPYGVRKGDMPTKKGMRVYDDMAVDPKSARAVENAAAARDVAEQTAPSPPFCPQKMPRIPAEEIEHARWTWCGHCGCAAVRCPACGIHSCTGGGCDACHDYFTAAIKMVNDGTAPAEAECYPEDE